MKMKHFAMILFCTMVSLTLSAQKKEFNPPYYVNGIPLDSLKGPYIHVTTMAARVFSRDLRLCIDYGQDNKFGFNESVLRTKKDIDVIFNSDIQVINFMDKNGFEYIDTHIKVWEGTSYTLYIFKKKY
jgi:hypothetical protein